MDFTTIRGRLDAGGYGGWDALADDMATMFANAMAFNRPDTVFHKQARARGVRLPLEQQALGRRLSGRCRARGARGRRANSPALGGTPALTRPYVAGTLAASRVWPLVRPSPAMLFARTRLAGAPADARARAARPRRWRA